MNINIDYNRFIVKRLSDGKEKAVSLSLSNVKATDKVRLNLF
jgi:hypothetical protein